MDISQLRRFITIAKEQNITKSANILHVSQPTLSSSISKLEEEVGVPLFNRVGKRIALNQYGEVFLHKAEFAVDALDEAVKQINSLLPDRKTVNISMTSPRFLQTLISDFTDSYPNIVLRKHEIMPVDVESEILNSDTNFVLADWYPGICPQAKHKIIRENKLHVALCKQHPLAKKAQISLEDIRNEPFIALPKGYAFRTITDRICKEYGFECNVLQECFHCHLLTYVQEGIGIAFVEKDSYSCDNLPIHNKNILIKEITDGPTRRLALFWRDGMPMSNAARLFLKYASSHCTD